MADFSDNAKVELKLLGTAFPALAFDNLPTLPRGKAVEVGGETAKKMLALAEEKPELPDDQIKVQVVEEDTTPEPSEALVDAVGKVTAENIAAETGSTALENVRDLSDEELLGVTGVGEATIADKIRVGGEDS